MLGAMSTASDRDDRDHSRHGRSELFFLVHHVVPPGSLPGGPSNPCPVSINRGHYLHPSPGVGALNAAFYVSGNSWPTSFSDNVQSRAADSRSRAHGACWSVTWQSAR